MKDDLQLIIYMRSWVQICNLVDLSNVTVCSSFHRSGS